MTRIKMAVVGCGHLGTIHARLLAAREDAELVAVVDPFAEARDRVAAAHGCEALADPADLVAIAGARPPVSARPPPRKLARLALLGRRAGKLTPRQRMKSPAERLEIPSTRITKSAMPSPFWSPWTNTPLALLSKRTSPILLSAVLNAAVPRNAKV